MLKDKILFRYKWGIWIFIVAAIFSIIFMTLDTFLCGDEVITIGMANSNNGWMLSTGRVQGYIQDEIIGESVFETFGNIRRVGKDFLVNKKQAQYFTYPRPRESGWYSGDIIHAWFSTEEGGRFNFRRVYLNAMGDDANSFLYYMLVHLMSSIIPSLSATKWCAFLVNLIALSIGMRILYTICGHMEVPKNMKYVICLAWGCSIGCITLTTYLRTYMITTALQMLLLQLHLELYEGWESQDDKYVNRKLTQLLIVYPIAYVAHYTSGLWAVALGIVALFFIGNKVEQSLKKRYSKRYIGFGTIAIIAGILIDPVSPLGLVTKFGVNSRKDLGQAFRGCLINLADEIWGGTFLLIMFVTLWGVNLFFRQKQEKNNRNTKIDILEFGLCIYCLSVILCTRQGYYKAVYPLFYIFICVELENFFRRFIRGQKLKTIIGILIFSMFILNNVYITYSQKTTEGTDYKTLKKVMSDYPTDQLLVVRDRKGEGFCYDHLWLWQNYKDVLLVSEPETTLEDYSEDAALRTIDQIMVMIYSPEDRLEDFVQWAENNFDTQRIITCYDSQTYTVLLWDKLTVTSEEM